MLDIGKKQSGNVLGIDSEGVEGDDTGFLIIMIATRYRDPTDDQVVVDFLDDMICGIRFLAIAEKQGASVLVYELYIRAPRCVLRLWKLEL